MVLGWLVQAIRHKMVLLELIKNTGYIINIYMACDHIELNINMYTRYT